MSDTPLNTGDELRAKIHKAMEQLYQFKSSRPNSLNHDNFYNTESKVARIVLADRKKHELQARLEEYQQGLLVGAMPEFIGRPMAEKRIAELKQELEKL